MKTFLASLLLVTRLSVAAAGTDYGFLSQGVSPLTTNGYAATNLSVRLSVPNSKHLLVGLSGEINILTETTAKGTNKAGSDTSEAYAGIYGSIRYLKDSDMGSYTAQQICDNKLGMVATPNQVTFSSRRQKLTVDVALDIESATNQCSDCEITGYVSVGLELETTAAHHFNFIIDIPETGSGSDQYNVIACWDANAWSTAEGGTASSYLYLKNSMLVVQEVLAFNS